MLRLQLNSDYESLLSENRLASFAEFMTIDTGTFFEQEEQRDVRRLQLGQQFFFLKRVTREKLSSALESYLGGKLAHSKPYKEMQHFSFLREHGFDTAEVVAVGEKLHFGIPIEGFIMTREVPGRDLSTVYQAAGVEDRIDIIRRFGALVGRLHDHGFFGSIRLKDIICDGEPYDRMQMTLIDREVRNPRPRSASKAATLDRLLLNTRRQTQQGEVFSAEEWATFSRNYCRSLSPPVQLEHSVVTSEILRISQKARATQEQS